jgi:Holliday junction resolvase-like predicted endonuclease
MRNSLIVFSFFIFHSNIGITDESRILLKLPYENREEILKSMRNNNNIMEKILLALSKKDFKKVEKLASLWLLNTNKSLKLPFRYDPNFIALAVDMHTTGTVEIIKAARKKDMSETLRSLSNFYNRCNSCHETYRVVEWPDKKYPEPKPVPLDIPKFYKYEDWIAK